MNKISNVSLADATEALNVLDKLPGYQTAKDTLRAYLQESGEPVAWRVRDFADGWIYSESDTLKYSEMTGAFSQPLYIHPQPVAMSALTPAGRAALKEDK